MGELNEVYRGAPEERQFIAAYLQQQRQLDFAQQIRNRERWPLAAALTAESCRLVIDPNLFESICEGVSASLQTRFPQFTLLDPERFYVARLDEWEDDPGGFHSRFAKGFKYLYNYGFAVLLRESHIENVQLRTAEVARSYIHDSIHACTFRSFRRCDSDRGKFLVYREQYGLNFRRESGTAYSKARTRIDDPTRINLNLLMDGLTVISVADGMSPWIEQVQPSDPSVTEAELVADLAAHSDGLRRGTKAHGFHNSVTAPSRRFLRCWGGANAQELLFRAMMTGNLKPASRYFQRIGGGWKELFMSPNWTRTAGSRGS